MYVGYHDYVDFCREGNCYSPAAGSYGMYKLFMLGDTYCEHLKAQYGHDVAVSDDWEHDE